MSIYGPKTPPPPRAVRMAMRARSEGDTGQRRGTILFLVALLALAGVGAYFSYLSESAKMEQMKIQLERAETIRLELERARETVEIGSADVLPSAAERRRIEQVVPSLPAVPTIEPPAPLQAAEIVTPERPQVEPPARLQSADILR